MLLSAFWEDTASDDLVKSKASDVMEKINKKAKEMGLLHRFQYMNYADPSQHPIESYGRDNVQFLKAVSRKYDPKGIFQYQAPGGFKL